MDLSWTLSILEHHMARLSTSQVEQLQSRFRLQLPRFYREFLLDHDESVETYDFGSGPVGENELMMELASLIKINEEVRNPELWFFGEHPWPAPYFAIGHDGYGCHYFIDTLGERPGILFQDSYSWVIERVADDCIGLIDYLRGKAEDLGTT
jgi:hypothetical protein